MRLSKLKAVGATLLVAILSVVGVTLIDGSIASASAASTAQVVEVPSDMGLGITFTWATILVAVTKTVTLVKSLLAKDWNAVLTLIISVLAAVGLVALVANSDFTGFTVPGLDVPLSRAKGGTVVLIGIVLGLAASYGRDVLKAIDNTQSTKEPRLLDG